MESKPAKLTIACDRCKTRKRRCDGGTPQWANFTVLLDAQYAASTTDATDHSARWTVVNAMLAVAIQFKTALGSEGCLSDILPPNLLSIQALLAMAIFARNTADRQAFVMLATNASQQLELFGSQTLDPMEADQHGQALRVVLVLRDEIRVEATHTYDLG
ncbi:hypothetical protein GGR54DRAFT_648420 [Hypoxylon sp. NC1633]|nr:hypothetical protein GGR54DRAFT_648420 [Hypoxylon sp. NC1633]